MTIDEVKDGLKALLEKMNVEEKELETPTESTDTEEVQRSLKNHMAEYQNLVAEKDRLETLESAKALRKTGSSLFERDGKAPLVKVKRSMNRQDKDNSFRLWLTGGVGPDAWKYSSDMTGSHWGSSSFFMQEVEKVERTQTTTTTAGGFLSDPHPQGFEKALKDFGGVLNLCNVEVTEDAGDYPITTWNPTALKAGYVAENTAVTTHSQVFAQKTLKAYALKTANFPISFESVLKSNRDLLALCEESIYEQIARQIAYLLINGAGAGSNEGSGILTDTIGATASGVTYASVLDGKLTPGFVNDFLATFDPSAINSPSFAIVGSNQTKFKLRGMTDTTGQPIVGYGYGAGVQGESVSGYRWQTDQDMPNYPLDTETKKLLVAGDWSKHYARLVGAKPQLMRETAFQASQMCYFVGGFQMFDCLYVNSGTNPIKYATVSYDAP